MAAMAVLFSHITISLEHFGLKPILGKTIDGIPKGLNLSTYGVTMFFTLKSKFAIVKSRA